MALEHETTKEPKRRVRVKRSAKVVTSGDKRRMTQTVNRYAELQIRIEEAQREQSSILLELYPCMKECGVKEWKTKAGLAERFTPASKSSTVIDTEALRERVTDEEFLDCVNVSVTKVRQVLSGKELELISEIIPGKKKPETIRVKVYKPEE